MWPRQAILSHFSRNNGILSIGVKVPNKMGKRRISSDYVQEQCDVWLTARQPKKQKVLMRVPLSVIHTRQADEEPMFTVPVAATKQTTLLDFFKRPREEKADYHFPQDKMKGSHEPQTPLIPKRGCHQVLHMSLTDQENIKPNNNIMVRSSTRQQTSKPEVPVAPISHKDPTLRHQDEKNSDVRDAESCGNWKSIGHKERHQTVVGVEKVASDKIELGNRKVLSFSSGACLCGKSCHRSNNQECQSRDSVLNTKNVSECLARKEETPSPYASFPESAIDPSVCSHMDHSCRVTFVPPGEAESLTPSCTCSQFDDNSMETLLVSKLAQVGSCEEDLSAWSSDCSKPVDETQSSLNIGQLHYVDPELLDTLSPENVVKHRSVSSAELFNSDPELILNPKLLKTVDSELHTCTVEMSTECCGDELSDTDLLANSLAVIGDQSPSEPLEFTPGTQDCLALRFATDTDDCDYEDSQRFD